MQDYTLNHDNECNMAYTNDLTNLKAFGITFLAKKIIVCKIYEKYILIMSILFLINCRCYFANHLVCQYKNGILVDLWLTLNLKFWS